MGVTGDELRRELRDAEYSEGYAESFLNAYIATQTKVIREQRGLTQVALAQLMGTTQTAISRIENVNYSAWNIKTLKKLARALGVRLKVSFETYGTLPDEVLSFGRDNLQREDREHDPGLWSDAPAESIREVVAANQRQWLIQYAARFNEWMDADRPAFHSTIPVQIGSTEMHSSPMGIGLLTQSLESTPSAAPSQNEVTGTTETQAIWTAATGGTATPETSVQRKPPRSARIFDSRTFRRHRRAMRGKRNVRAS